MFSANSLIHLIEFGSQLFVAWILLADDIGRIKSLQTFASVGVIIAGLGFNTSILKLCSEKDVTDEEKQTLFASAIKTTLLFSFLTILLAIVLSFLISKRKLSKIGNVLLEFKTPLMPCICFNKTEKLEKTGLQFCGLIMGDHSKCSINTMFNTGTVVGVFANIFGGNFPPNFIPSFSWGGASGFETYRTDKAFEVAEQVMHRRGIDLTATDKDILSNIFELTKKYRN